MIRKNQPEQGQSRWLPPHSRSPQQHRTQFASFPSFALSQECSLSPAQNDLLVFNSVKAFVKVIGQCQQVFWNLYLIKRCLYLWKCEVNTPIAPKGISLGMKVLQLENRLVSLRVHTPLKYLMHITNMKDQKRNWSFYTTKNCLYKGRR